MILLEQSFSDRIPSLTATVGYSHQGEDASVLLSGVIYTL